MDYYLQTELKRTENVEFKKKSCSKPKKKNCFWTLKIDWFEPKLCENTYINKYKMPDHDKTFVWSVPTTLIMKVINIYVPNRFDMHVNYYYWSILKLITHNIF